MTATLALSLLLALASAAALNWAFYRQHGQVSAMPPLSPARPVRSLRLLFSNRRWLLGFGVGILGWVSYVAALRFGPLSLVQAASAGGIGVLALLVWRWGGIGLSRREWGGVGSSLGGLFALGLSMVGGRGAHPVVGHASWLAIALWLLASGLVAGVFAGPGRRLVAAGAGLGIGAGFLYAAGDVATKAAVAGGWRLLFVPALLAAHGLAFILLQLAFQRGKALATAGVATLFTNAVPIAAGMAVFHEPLPSGARGVLRVLAFAAVVAGAVLLTYTTQPTETTMTPPLRRRSLARRVALLSLAATTVVAAVAAVSGAGSTSAPARRPVAQAPTAPLTGIHKIRHVVVIMQENRSFDSYFGTHPGANGIPMRNGVPTVCVPDPQTKRCVKPYHDTSNRNGGGPHQHMNALRDINHARMDGFIAQERRAAHYACKGTNDPRCALASRAPAPDVMDYHNQHEIPNYWAYARNYVLQDSMFQSDTSWSLPAISISSRAGRRSAPGSGGR